MSYVTGDRCLIKRGRAEGEVELTPPFASLPLMPSPPPPPLPPDRVRAIVDSGDPQLHAQLAGTPGFCLQPMPWPAAAAAVSDGSVQALGRMGRDAEGVRVYWKWKDEVCGWREVWWLMTSPVSQLTTFLSLPTAGRHACIHR